MNWCQYFGARYYDPNISIWLSVDPLSDKAPGWTPYRYGFNNPNSHVDYNGQIEWPLRGNSAVNKRDVTGGGWGLTNTVIRTSTYLDTDRPPGASNPHIGIDYRAKEGTTFYSVGDGSVVAMGESKRGGKFVTVEYGNGDRMTFRHINSTEDIEIGSKVYEGQPLGETGKTGTSAAHLHIDVKDADGNRVDPENRNYGSVSNEQFFNKYGGDWKCLKQAKEAAINKINDAGLEAQ